jgi:hypothetical protein
MTARETRPDPGIAQDAGGADCVVLGTDPSLMPEPVNRRSRAFLIWLLSHRDAKRGQLAVDWSELAS